MAIYNGAGMWQIFFMLRVDLSHLQDVPLPESIAFPLENKQYSVKVGGFLCDGYRQEVQSTHASMLEFGAKRLLLLEFLGDVKLYGFTEKNVLCAIALCQWCRYKAQQVLPSLLLDLARKADDILSGAIVTGVDVRDQSSRWASCSLRLNKASGQANVRIHFNWRTLLLPPALATHLCWHELCHIRQQNHGSEFKKLLANYSPDADSHEKALNAAWRAMPAWALSTLMTRGIFKIGSRRELKSL